MTEKSKAPSPKNIAGRVEMLVRETIEGMGYVLWDVEYAKDGGEWDLTIFIDKSEGVGIEDCIAVHKAVDPLIDNADPIEGFYYLQISTAGIERELKRPEHFAHYVSKEIEIRFFAPTDFDGVKIKSLRGILEKYENKIITINYEGKTFDIDSAKCGLVKSVE